MSIQRLHVGARLSETAVHQGVVYLAGQVADDPSQDMTGQTRQVLAAIDRLLAEVGGDRARTAVLNTLKCRPPGNRPPTRPETANCRPWTAAQLDLVAPAVVVTLGLSATRWFLPGKEPLGTVRGRLHPAPLPGGRELQVLPTYHPSAAIRNGPQGEPMALLREDLALAVRLSTGPRKRS